MYLTMINPLRRRRDVPEDLFYAYWRDTHVAVAARLPGIDTLWTHWVSWQGGRSWPAIHGIDGDLAEPDIFEGVPEPCFATEADLERFGTAMAPLMVDEANIFERTISYRSMGTNSTTMRDLLPHAPNGNHRSLKYMLFIRRRSDVPLSEFRTGTLRLFTGLATDPTVHKLRLHLFEEYDDSEVFLDSRSNAVSHRMALENQHQAVVEIAFADAEGRARFHQSSKWTAAVPLQRDLFAALHPFGVTRTYTWRIDGKATLATVRGAAAVEQIMQIGAENQLDPATLALFMQTNAELDDLQLADVRTRLHDDVGRLTASPQ